MKVGGSGIEVRPATKCASCFGSRGPPGPGWACRPAGCRQESRAGGPVVKHETWLLPWARTPRRLSDGLRTPRAICTS